MLQAFWYLSSLSVVGVLCHDYVIDRFELVASLIIFAVNSSLMNLCALCGNSWIAISR